MLDIIKQVVKIAKLPGHIQQYRELGGGEVNDTYVIQTPNEQFVLRIAKYSDQNTLQNEAWALGQLNHPQIPKLIYYDPLKNINDRQFIIESYIEGTRTDRLTLNQFNSLGSLLANIHNNKSDKYGVNPWERLLDSCKYFFTEEQLLKHPDSQLKELILLTKQYISDKFNDKINIQPSLIHCDATPSNIIVQGNEVALIDWEFARYNDPMADFATIFYEDIEYNRGKWRLKIMPSEKDALFDGYTNSGKVIDSDRVQLWMVIDKLGACVFLHWRIHHSGREADQKQLEQYKIDYHNLKESLTNFFT